MCNRKHKILLLLFAFAIVLSGCVNTKIIDDIDIEGAVAFEKLNGEIQGTVLVQEYLPDKSIENKTYTSKAKTRKEILLKNQKQTSKPIVLGGLKVTLFGEKLAKHGISEFLDSYQRDPTSGARGFLTTTEGDPAKILQGKYGILGNSIYLNDLIVHNMEERDVPITNMHIFLRDYYAKGIDPYLPQLKQKDEAHVEISGISIFKGDQLKFTIPQEDMFYFKLMRDRYTKGTFQIYFGKKSASIKSIKSKYKYVLPNKDASELVINVQINGVIQEYSDGIITKGDIRKMERALEKKVEKECMDLIKTFREEEVDPLGIGVYFRKKIRGYPFKERYEMDYQNIKIKVECHATIDETGVIN